MKTIARFLLVIFLTLVTGFCVFGFLAAGEVEGTAQLKWRLAYSLIGLASLAGIVATAKSFGTNSE